ncbi:MAG: hypothetical protein ACK5TU_03645 [Cyclobacteriaceae bacterium]|jgi:hypothetical protein|nr:hypothetical protein [Sediminibacterium sp.]
MKTKSNVLVLTALCASAAFAANQAIEPQPTGKMYAGLSYAQSRSGQSASSGLILGVWGAVHSSVSGAVYGAVFGGPVGFAVGLGIGL